MEKSSPATFSIPDESFAREKQDLFGNPKEFEARITQRTFEFLDALETEGNLGVDLTLIYRVWASPYRSSADADHLGHVILFWNTSRITLESPSMLLMHSGGRAP